MEPPKRPNQRSTGQKLTRKRIPLSCVACRMRKLKCNREKPCQNCMVRGESNAASCTYAEKPERKNMPKFNPQSDAEDMRKRIARLEKSILSVISQQGETPPVNERSSPADATDDNQTDQYDPAPYQVGGQKISADTRSTHWDAILNEIGAMKDVWSEENDTTEVSSRLLPSNNNYRPSFLTGLSPPPERLVVMASIPSREVTDELLAHCFTNPNPAIPVRYLFHKPTFLREYEEHWIDPSKTKTIWIGLLFGILCHALQAYRRSDTGPPECGETLDTTIELYRLRVAQCLAIANVTKPVKYMVEVMLIYSMAEYADESDDDIGTWLLSGYVLRLALQQGYHRDPSHHPNISVFDGEMRRRVWCFISQHELLFSIKTGLPTGIRYSECDTNPPRNLSDNELFEGMTELPSSRPDTEYTDMTYFVVKYPIMRAYGKVIEFLHVVEPQSYNEVLRLDSILLEAHESVPSHFRLYAFEKMKDIPPYQIMERCIIHIFSHKAVCLLHRKYWNEAPSGNIGLNYSQKRCVQSSIALLDQQAAMHQASYPAGLLSGLKWHHFGIIAHDFLLAAIIICLDLTMMNRETADLSATSLETLEKTNKIRRAKVIWEDILHCCPDARRPVTILTKVLNKLSNTTVKASLPTSSTTPVPQPLQFNQTFVAQPELDTAGSFIPINEYDTIMQEDFICSGTFFDNLVSEQNQTTNFDWDAWDQFLSSQAPECDMKPIYDTM